VTAPAARGSLALLAGSQAMLFAVTGRLIAELVTGEAPFVDPGPYSAARFGA
jgi:D-amino-acid dehydrogenase